MAHLCVHLSPYNVTDAKLMLFGSSANEFGSPNSDIDISMKLPGNFEVCIDSSLCRTSTY